MTSVLEAIRKTHKHHHHDHKSSPTDTLWEFLIKLHLIDGHT